MAIVIISPNMQLPVPIVGRTPGPEYATDIDSCLTLIDQHDHTPGKGVLVPTAGLNINADLPLNGFFARSTAGVTLSAQGSTPANNTIYESGVDLYFVDGNGNNIRLTQSGGPTPGSGITQLTGDVTAGPGSGSQVTTIANNAVTFAKIQNISTANLLGRSTAGTGNVEQISVGTGLTLSGGTLSSTVVGLASDFASTNSLTTHQFSTAAAITKSSSADTNQYLLASTDNNSNSNRSSDVVIATGSNSGSAGTGSLRFYVGNALGGGNDGNIVFRAFGTGGMDIETAGLIDITSDANLTPAIQLYTSNNSASISLRSNAIHFGDTVAAALSFIGTASFFANSTSTIIQASSSNSGWTFTLPPNAGSSGQFLQTNGSGVTSWASPSAASGSFTTVDSKTVTVVNGIITSIV